MARPGGSLGGAWYFAYHFQQKQRWLRLGSVDAFSLGDARKLARKALAAVESGQDPASSSTPVALSIPERAARKALSFIQQGIEPVCYLYRHYHADGRLLYVGITLDPLRRQHHHAKTAAWRDMIFQIVIEPFATREEALAAELFAIRAEFPRFNTTHNSHRHPFQELSRKLSHNMTDDRSSLNPLVVRHGKRSARSG